MEALLRSMTSLWLWPVLGLTAFLAGAINSVAGGGTLLTFPALLMVLPLVQANVTSTVALVPGSVASAWGYRSELEGNLPWLRLLLGPSLAGRCWAPCCWSLYPAESSKPWCPGCSSWPPCCSCFNRS